MAELLQQLLEISTTVYRDKIAVSDGRKTITYGELNQLSHQLAHTLKTVGVVKGDRLGIYLNKSLETVIAIFGILKAGGIYVPLDPSAPVKRIAFLLEDCDIKVIISNKKKFNPLQRILDQTSPLKTVILTDSETSPSDANPVKLISYKEVLKATSTPVSLDLTPDDLAYILYTSGSTGQPKGVMISHSAALNFIKWSCECFQIQESDRLANHPPFHFDLSIFDLFTTIKAGGTVILISGTLSVFPVTLAQFIAEQKITQQVLVSDPRYRELKLPKVYRTGDLVKQKKDGNYLFLGRKDNIIKSRGYRIDLGEIEQTISNHPAVQEVVVIPIPHEEMGNLLKAIIVVAPNSEIYAKDLAYYCSQFLPKYMIPEFEFVKSLPKTSTGKIDRALLKTILSVFKTKDNQDKKNLWENNWSKEDFSPSWQIRNNLPQEIKSAVEEKWFTQGTKILDLGCGSGEIAAYLAEKGFNVVGVDWAEGAIKKAKEKQGEIANKLTFKALDICQEKAEYPEFQGLVDRGCFHTISLNLHQDYVNTVASYALPKAHFLLLCRICDPADIPLPINQLQQQEEQMKKYLQQLFQPKFAILKMKATLIERTSPALDVPALAVYLIK